MNVHVTAFVGVNMLVEEFSGMSMAVLMRLVPESLANTPNHIKKAEGDKQPCGEVAPYRLDIYEAFDSQAQRYS